MPFDGQVLCQRMLIGPWALTTAGAATVAAAPAAATFKKRRRVEVVSLVGRVFCPFDAEPWWTGLDLLAATQRLARWFGKNHQGDATLRRRLLKKLRNTRRVLF